MEQSMPFFNDTLLVQKPAAVSDGYAGGMQAARDAKNLTGGTPGTVNCVAFAYTIAGKNLKAFEWNSLSILDNYSDYGENCGAYVQANKYGTGSTWGKCVEVCDTTPNAPGGVIGQELDIWVSGDDTGSRVGLDITVGDARKIRNLPNYGKAIATYGIRVVASSTTPWAKFSYGAAYYDFLQSGLLLSSNAVRAIELRGSYIVGVDTSQAATTEAIRLGAGQRVSFEATGTITFGWENDKLTLRRGATEVFSVDTNTGNIFKNGTKVL